MNITAAIDQTIRLYNCNAADTVRVREEMPDGKYKIEPLRKIVYSGNLRPQFGDIRLFIFEDFDSMSEICQNALLKFIEEPHEYNKFIMTAQSKADILPTILSRVVVVCSYGDDNVNVHESGQHEQTDECKAAKAITAALLRKDEYSVAAEFAQIKDRLVLIEVLRELMQQLLDVRQLNAIDIVSKYIKRMQVNPNIAMTTACCAAELFKEITSNGDYRG
jgi:hypothetical protein